MQTQLSLQLAPVTKRVYQPRGINAVQLLFKKHFQSLADRYEDKHAIIYGRFRIQRITEVVEKFILCGDYTPGTMWQTLLVFLLDEPISHLDTRQRAYMRAYLKRLHIELGYTMIYVTHDQEEAMALSDRVAVMNQGLINQVGTPAEIFSNPSDLFVAGFIGEPPMNFLDCEYAQDGRRGVLRHNEVSIDTPPQSQPSIQRDAIPQRVVLGIRPFYIDIGLERSSRYTIPADVFVVEPLGDITLVSVDVFDTRFQVLTDPEFRAHPKQRLWLAFDPAHTLLFDGTTGKALLNEA